MSKLISASELIDIADKAIEDENTNPDGRLSAMDLIVPINAISARVTRNEFGQEKVDIKDIVKAKSHGLFAAKLIGNFQKACKSLNLIRSLYPGLSEEEVEELNEYSEKIKTIFEDNFGTVDPSKMDEIKGHKNYSNYESERNKIREEYRGVIKASEDIKDAIIEINKTPMIKPDFDYITDEDLSKVEISPDDIESIWIFLERSLV